SSNEPGGDEQRDVARREREEHRNEDELTRRREAVADFELDARGDRVCDHRQDGRRRRERAPGRKEEGGRSRSGDEGESQRERKALLERAHAAARTLTGALYEIGSKRIT